MAQNKAEKSYLASAVDSVWGPPKSSTSKPRTASGTAEFSGLKAQQREDHSIHRLGGISSRRYPEDFPKEKVRWFHATDIPKRKPNLLPPGSPAPPKDNKPPAAPRKFMTFSAQDSNSIEAAYQRLVEEEYDRTLAQSRGASNGASEDGQKRESWRNQTKIPVLEDYLFDVDLSSFELAPAYWLGPVFEVRRGSWFYADGRPCEENLAYQLEEGFLKIKPFRFAKPQPKEKVVKEQKSSMYSMFGSGRAKAGPGSTEVTPRGSIDEVRGETQVEAEPPSGGKESPPNQNQPVYRLFGTYMNSVVTYQDSTVAWLATENLMSSVFQRFAPGGYGAVKVTRGYTEPESKESKKPKVESETSPTAPNTAHPSTQADQKLQVDETQRKLLKRRSAPASTTAESAREAIESARESKAEVLRDHVSVVDDSAENEEAARKRAEKEAQNDYDDNTEEQGRPIEHLILVTHGIGQKLGYRTAGVNFVHDVNLFRKTLKSVFADSADLQALNTEVDRLPINCRIQVLPVCWRHLLDFPRQGVKNRRERDLGDIEQEEEEYPSLADITIDGVQFVRSLVTDVALDILLYQSPYYKDHISKIVLSECNRVYKLFLQRNLEFKGKVSLAGHSLGSAILFDILCSQSEDVNIDNSSRHKYPRRNRTNPTPNGQSKLKEFELDFEVDSFFALGSPIGLFQMLGGLKVAARHSSIEQPSLKSSISSEFIDEPLASPSDSSFLPFSVSAPKCSQLYNIFYASDPISYRIEPLVAPAMATLKPQQLPFTKKGMFTTSASQGFTGIGTKMGQSVSGLFTSLGSGIASSLLNRSLGLSGEDFASMNAPQIPTPRAPSPSPGAGTNISSGGVISVPILTRSETAEKKKQLAAEATKADREGGGERAPTLIDSEMETLYAGFEKSRQRQPSESKEDTYDSGGEEEGKKLRKEELKIRALNQSGRIDFVIQESYIEFNPLSTFTSHLMYWQDEDLSHFVMGQLLSRRTLSSADKDVDSSLGERRDGKKTRKFSSNWI